MKTVKQIKRMQYTENERVFYSVSDVDKLREELKEIMLINYDAFHNNSSEMYDNNIKDIDELFDNFKGDENESKL